MGACDHEGAAPEIGRGAEAAALVELQAQAPALLTEVQAQRERAGQRVGPGETARAEIEAFAREVVAQGDAESAIAEDVVVVETARIERAARDRDARSAELDREAVLGAVEGHAAGGEGRTQRYDRGRPFD